MAQDKNAVAALGTAIRKARNEAGKTLDAVAQECGIYAPNLADIEQGRREPKAILLGKIASALGVPVDSLLGNAPVLS